MKDLEDLYTEFSKMPIAEMQQTDVITCVTPGAQPVGQTAILRARLGGLGSVAFLCNVRPSNLRRGQTIVAEYKETKRLAQSLMTKKKAKKGAGQPATPASGTPMSRSE